MLFKYGGKIAAVIKAAFSGNFGDGKIGLPEQIIRSASEKVGSDHINIEKREVYLI